MQTKTLEELIAAGGKFYPMDGESWVDLPTTSWKFNPATGLYENQDEDEREAS
jgi:hypothetical protein